MMVTILVIKFQGQQEEGKHLIIEASPGILLIKTGLNGNTKEQNMILKVHLETNSF